MIVVAVVMFSVILIIAVAAFVNTLVTGLIVAAVVVVSVSLGIVVVAVIGALISRLIVFGRAYLGVLGSVAKLRY